MKNTSKIYKFAFAVGLFGALFLGWVNGAVGIIGSEDNPANLLYLSVYIVGLIGVIISRFKARGMSYTLFAVAITQFLVPLYGLFIWPAKASWGDAGVIGVLIFNSVMALIFVVSGILFRRASIVNK